MSLTLILILALQAAAAPAPAAPSPPAAGPRWAMINPAAGNAGSFDLARYQAPGEGRCLGAAAGDVLVCGRRGGRGDYPIEMWDRIYAPRPIRAEMNLGGNVQGRIHAEAVPMDRGAVSNRVMVGIRWPF